MQAFVLLEKKYWWAWISPQLQAALEFWGWVFFEGFS
jgi:hypothetical protein